MLVTLILQTKQRNFLKKNYLATLMKRFRFRMHQKKLEMLHRHPKRVSILKIQRQRKPIPKIRRIKIKENIITAENAAPQDITIPLALQTFSKKDKKFWFRLLKIRLAQKGPG